jgi:hypothetical protein
LQQQTLQITQNRKPHMHAQATLKTMSDTNKAWKQNDLWFLTDAARQQVTDIHKTYFLSRSIGAVAGTITHAKKKYPVDCAASPGYIPPQPKTTIPEQVRADNLMISLPLPTIQPSERCKCVCVYGYVFLTII